MREAYFTYEYKNISELLVEMRDAKFNIAIVLDEYGETAGIITLEDVLEEIVGEIRDEYDEAEEELIQKVNDQEYIVEGSMNLDDLNDNLGTELESEDYDSLSEDLSLSIWTDFRKLEIISRLKIRFAL